MKILMIVNGPPYGSELPFNALSWPTGPSRPNAS